LAPCADLAREMGLDVSFAAMLLRLTPLAPDFVEAILMGEEPSGLSVTMLTEQLRCFGKPFSAILRELKLAYPGKPAPSVVPAASEKGKTAKGLCPTPSYAQE
jgi:hypothetical protein